MHNTLCPGRREIHWGALEQTFRTPPPNRALGPMTKTKEGSGRGRRTRRRRRRRTNEPALAGHLVYAAKEHETRIGASFAPPHISLSGTFVVKNPFPGLQRTLKSRGGFNGRGGIGGSRIPQHMYLKMITNTHRSF